MAAETERFVLVGGGPAALAAARSYRDAGAVGEVLMLSADTEPRQPRRPAARHRGGRS
ncbi:hypothetical protein [Amycolatopsis sp.]|uniref:hypothetical protein n=1 Tax=Amycolatopsis sp. TaxID=37632 RepID=UPI0026144281|nr:hypothetical protein [Amycolatopsis sp.]